MPTVLAKDVADAGFVRARALLTAAHGGAVPQIEHDLYRMALVTAVGTLDAFMHFLVLRAATQHVALPRSLRRLEIEFGELASLADQTKRRQREGRRQRPWVKAKRALQDRLLRETFQSFDQLGSAMSMAGIEKGWTKVQARLGAEWNATDTKAWLDALVYRRNRIVHECDVRRRERPRAVDLQPITQDDVEKHIGWLEELVAAIWDVYNA